MRIAGLVIGLAISFAATADTVRLRDDAPDRHVVVKGDTLWDISAKFLKSPWLWPEVWQINKAQIKNPHLIYPGDIVYLTITAAGPRLSKMETVKLSPAVRTEAILREAPIPTVPYAVVKAFLQRPLVANAATLERMPRLIAAEDDRVMVATGDRVYASEIDEFTRDWHLVRLGRPFRDPDSGEVIAREVGYVGDARTLKAGRPGKLTITKAELEVLPGDRLMPAIEPDSVDFLPRPPNVAVEGRIIAAYGGVRAAPRYATVVINKGKADGVEIGHVLSVFRAGRTIGPDPERGRFESFNPRSGFLHAEQERAHRVRYENVGEEALDALDPLDFFFKPMPDGRRGWRYVGYQCVKPDGQVVANASPDSAEASEDCTGKGGGRRWAYMDIGCLKPGKEVSFGQPFDPKEVFDRDCRPSVTKLPDLETGHILIYRSFDRVAYGLVMDATEPLFLLDIVRNPTP